eukprot:SAG11_NODE_19574_length_463_cov_6.008242_1_plen_114_part_01
MIRYGPYHKGFNFLEGRFLNLFSSIPFIDMCVQFALVVGGVGDSSMRIIAEIRPMRSCTDGSSDRGTVPQNNVPYRASKVQTTEHAHIKVFLIYSEQRQTKSQKRRQSHKKLCG